MNNKFLNLFTGVLEKSKEVLYYPVVGLYKLKVKARVKE